MNIDYLRSLFEILNNPFNRADKMRAVIKIVWWKFNQLFFFKPIIIEIAPGYKCICYPNSAYGSLVVYSTFPEFAEMNFLYQIIKKDDIFFDIGANIGVNSLLAASKIKAGKIFAFEPANKALSNLYENIKINHLNQKIVVVNKVVSDKDGRDFFIFDEIVELSHISYSNSYKGKKEMRETITLDKFCMDHKLKRINVVKIDVEGAEFKVLKGFEGYLGKGLVEYLVVEINKACNLYGFTEMDVFNFLRQKGFIVYIFNKKYKLEKLVDIEQTSSKTYNIVAVLNNQIVVKRIKQFII